MERIKEKIKKLIDTNNVPNILLHGPFLSGKEVMSDYIINYIYKNDKNIIDKYVLKINCLSNNGIKKIKENIKLFSMQIINNKCNINFKIILLQYSEYLTYDSQYSLRRTIEQYNHNTRFILLCENKFKLLNPICSRFSHFYINSNSNIIVNNNFNYNKYNKIMNNFKNINNSSNPLYNTFLLSKELYLNNYYSYEILNRFKNNINYNNVKLIYGNLCYNIKDEILSIFFLLNIFRNNYKIEISKIY
tara:strand:- start:792 stop:1532 length:741 start_codon:yes stop_codon:yes gene_type:complete